MAYQFANRFIMTTAYDDSRRASHLDSKQHNITQYDTIYRWEYIKCISTKKKSKGKRKTKEKDII